MISMKGYCVLDCDFYSNCMVLFCCIIYSYNFVMVLFCADNLAAEAVICSYRLLVLFLRSDNYSCSYFLISD